MQIRRNYVNIGDNGRPRLVHFRISGEGPPLVMLHASPMSSTALLPLIRVAAEFATLIAPDTPGYGRSDPLAESGDGLDVYVEALHRFTGQLGLTRFALYGSATGAQIAIEYAKAYADRLSCLILDNAAHFTDEERQRIVAGYFPDLSPDATGSHLIRTWSIARDQGLFFPWHEHNAAARLPAGGINLDFVQMLALEYLQAGKDYDRAYRAAFANEKMDRMRPITVPTVILRWEGSILKPYTDRFDSVEWPDNFTMLHCSPEREQRLQAFKRIFTEGFFRADGESRRPELPDRDPFAGAASAVSPEFLDTEAGQCHYLSAGDRQSPRLLLLHDLGSSHQSLSALIDSLADEYCVLAPDLPGHGLSDAPGEGKHGINEVVDMLLDWLAALEWDGGFRLLAVKDGAAIAAQLARRAGRSVRELRLINPIDYPALKDEWEPDQLCYDFRLSDCGAHFLRVWHMLRDRQLFWPRNATEPAHALGGEANLDAGYLTRLFREFWQAQPVLDELRRQALDYPLSGELGNLQCPVRVEMREREPLTAVGVRSMRAYNN